MNTGKSNIVKRIFGIGAIPVGTILIFYLLCAGQGITFFETSNHVLIFLRSVATVSLTTFALSINLDSGRFDFSLGSVSLLASVIGATLTIRYSLSSTAMLVITLLAGIVLGMISGILYVLLKLPALITSLGVTLLYEALVSMISGSGVSFGTKVELTQFAASIPNMVIVTLVAFLFMYIVMNGTKFGFHYAALKDGQKVAVDTGIKEVGNAVGCYAIAGGMMAMVGYINATLTGTIQASLNFGSMGAMFVAFLPMFIGAFIGRFSENHFGIILGAITYAAIQLGFVRLGLSSEIQSLVSALVLVGFLIYLNNEHTFAALITGKKKSGAQK